MTIAPPASTTSPARARAAAWSSCVSATIAIRSPSTSTPPGASASPASGRTSRPSAMKTLAATALSSGGQRRIPVALAGARLPRVPLGQDAHGQIRDPHGVLDPTVDEAIGDPVGDRGADGARAEPVEAGHREDGGGFHLEVEHAGPAQVVDLVAKERLLVPVEARAALAAIEGGGRAAHAEVVPQREALGRFHQRRRDRVVGDGWIRGVDVVLAGSVVAHRARRDDDVAALDLTLERGRGPHADERVAAE